MPLDIAPIVDVNGQRLDDAMLNKLLDLRVETEFRVPARCTLRFLDENYAISGSESLALGTTVTVKDGASNVLVEAEIITVELEHNGSQPTFVVVAHDHAHRLGRSTAVKTYLNQSYSDVVSAVARKHGLEPEVDSTGTSIDYLLQVESDFDLLNTLADRVGYDWWVEAKTLYFRKPQDSAKVDVTVYDDLKTFCVRATGDYPDSVEVKGWDRKRQSAVRGKTSVASAKVKAESVLAGRVASPDQAFGAGLVVTSNLGAANDAEAGTLSGALLDRIVAAAVEARGTMSGNGLLKPGMAVNVKKAGPASGTYHVTKVEHVYDTERGFETSFAAGDRRPNSLVDLLGPGDARDGAFRHQGVVVGQVTNINDPARTGRVKVRYPGLTEGEESEWARLLTTGGGKDRGAVFIPEVKDEVLVAFEGGDPRQPVVLGGLYGDASTIPKWDVVNGVVNSRRMTSRSGHYVEFGDGENDATQHLALFLAGGAHKLRLGKDRVDLEVPAGKPIAIKSGNGSITLDAQGKITISGQEVSIEGTTKVSIKAPTVEVKATGSLNVESEAAASVKANASMQIDGGASTTIKGAVVAIN